MPRPRGCRRINCNPNITFYKPQGIPLNSLDVVEVTHEEWEALRLRYVEELDQKSSADEMGTSQSTMQRILSSVQSKIGRAIVEGKAIRILK